MAGTVTALACPVGGLLTAIAVASLGIMGGRALDQQQSSEAKLRLYSELMSRREESEATLRKEMFQSIIGSFFDPTAGSLDVRTRARDVHLVQPELYTDPSRRDMPFFVRPFLGLMRVTEFLRMRVERGQHRWSVQPIPMHHRLPCRLCGLRWRHALGGAGGGEAGLEWL